MRRARRLVHLGLVIAALFCGKAIAQQPLVTGNLTLYYDFDQIVANDDGDKEFLDGSGNDFHGTIHEGDLDFDVEPGTLTVETENVLRGLGSARFLQSTVASDLPAYVDVHGEDITFDHFERLPTSGLNDEYGLTVAAWLNVTANNVGDQSVFQARTSTGGHGAPHFQLQGNGRLRMTFRNQNGGNVVDAPQVFVDGTEDSGEAYPVDEWFHYAGTYDAFDNEWAMYYNGVQIATGTGTGEDLGDWGGLDTDLFAAGFGAVYDSGGRRLDGLMDELYVFNRALTADEIGVLVDVSPVILGGDFNNDGVADAADLDLLGADAAAGTNTAVYDLNADGLVNAADRDVFLSGDIITGGNKLNGDADFSGDVQFPDFAILADNFGLPGVWSSGDFDVSGEVQFPDFVILADNFGLSAAAAATVPEPSGVVLFVVAGLLCGWARRRAREG